MFVLYMLLGVLAIWILSAVPIGPALGFLGVLAWVGLLLYLIFDRPDPVMQVFEERKSS